MTLHDAAGVCTRAYNLGVCRLLNFLNRLRGTAGSVRPRGCYPGDEWRVRYPSIFTLAPELLNRAQAESKRGAAFSEEVHHA